jgi:hypothetical protein
MNSPAGILITAIALLAVLIARRWVAALAARSDVAARLRTLYTLLAALLALRLLAPLLASAPLAVALMTVAAWLPIAALRLVEELCRRHAPRPVKMVALGGALGFTAMALTIGLVWSAGAIRALAAFQSGMLVTTVWLLARSRDGLAPAERRTADTFLVALLLAIPLALTDFTYLFPELPVRGGPFAVLILLLATSRLTAEQGTVPRLAADLGTVAAASGAAVAVGYLASPALGGSVGAILAGGVAAIAALLLLVERFAALRSRQSGLITALAATPADDTDAIISAHPLLETGRMLGDAELSQYPPESVARLFDHPVISAETHDQDARDAGRDLLDATGATHLLRVSRNPPRLLAVTAGGLSDRSLDDELAVASRLIERTA